MNSTESKINTGPAHLRLFGNLMLEIQLCIPCHNQKATVRKCSGENQRGSFVFHSNEAPLTETDGGNHRPHLGFGIGVQSNTVVSVFVQVAEDGVVSAPVESDLPICTRRSCLFNPAFELKQFRVIVQLCAGQWNELNHGKRNSYRIS